MPRHLDKNSAPPSNRLRSVREELMLSKAELARRAGLSAMTIDRIEDGENCRMDTKRKIILALGLKLEEKDKVFGAEERRP
ncbi:MAG: helix-turn-helix transcriptional regulator [Deltaproteobacteria bacterium]|nr:helix-turn-helix transcriptional regulator [Deltaproteobacteria bacterium]